MNEDVDIGEDHGSFMVSSRSLDRSRSIPGRTPPVALDTGRSTRPRRAGFGLATTRSRASSISEVKVRPSSAARFLARRMSSSFILMVVLMHQDISMRHQYVKADSPMKPPCCCSADNLSMSPLRATLFNVHCGPMIQPGDEKATENLARYIVRASFSQERMTYAQDQSRFSTGARIERMKGSLTRWNGWRPCVPTPPTRESRWSDTTATTAMSPGADERKGMKMRRFPASLNLKDHQRSRNAQAESRSAPPPR